MMKGSEEPLSLMTWLCIFFTWILSPVGKKKKDLYVSHMKIKGIK